MSVLYPQICTESSSLGSSFKHKVQADVRIGATVKAGTQECGTERGTEVMWFALGIVYHGVVPTLFVCFWGGPSYPRGRGGEERAWFQLFSHALNYLGFNHVLISGRVLLTPSKSHGRLHDVVIHPIKPA